MDLGEALLPHELLAIARDESGAELARARRARKVPKGFKEALSELERALQGQRIVWLEGRHLPQEMELSPAARGVRLAGR